MEISNHTIQVFTMESGKTDDSFNVNLALKQGTIVAAALYVNGAKPTENINVSIEDSNNRTILEETHYGEFIRSTAASNFYNSLRPLVLPRQTITIKLRANTALASDFTGQIQFYYANGESSVVNANTDFSTTQNPSCN